MKKKKHANHFGPKASSRDGARDSARGLTPPSKSHPRADHALSNPLEVDPFASCDGLFDDDALLDGAAPAISLPGNEGLHAKVLVLNRAYAAMRVISAKRAFVLLARNIAEVIHLDVSDGSDDADGAIHRGQFINYDFDSWAELSPLRAQFERERHDWVRTVRMEIAVPRIIRLLGYDRLPESGVKLNRRNLFARDRNRCQYCGKIFTTSDLSIDHVKPRAQGGGDTWENLVCSCIRCNARKGGRTPEQASMKLIKKPERPRRNPLITLRLGHEKYSSWKAFLDHAYWSVELG